MRVTIRQKNLLITPALSRYIENKLLRPLRRRLKENISQRLPILDLELGRNSHHHRKGKVYHAEARLTLGKRILHAEVDVESIRAACDLLERELDQEIRVYKGKRFAIAKREGRRIKREIRYAPAARLRRKGRVRHEGN